MNNLTKTLICFAALGNSLSYPSDLFDKSLDTGRMQARSGTGIGGTVSAAEIIDWCEDTSLNLNDIIRKSKRELLRSKNYFKANGKLIEQFEGLLTNEQMLESTYLAQLIERVVRFYWHMEGNIEDKNGKKDKLLYEFLIEYIELIKSYAFEIDMAVNDTDGEGVKLIETLFIDYAKKQALHVRDFNYTGSDGSEIYVKNPEFFLDSVNFIIGEVANDFRYSNLEEGFSCAIKKAKIVQREIYDESVRIKMNEKYELLMDFINNMNICH